MKKAGILAGATLAGLLALSPLAFADEGPGDDGGAAGIVNGLNGNDVNVPVQACGNNVNGVGAQVPDITGALGGNAVAPGDGCAQPAQAGDN